MRTHDHQLAEGVCESIAHTTPRFRPPSQSTSLLRELAGWIVVGLLILTAFALLRAIGG